MKKKLIKENFKPILWKEVVDGQEIYTEGTHLGEFIAYGPHRVSDKEKRELINSRGQTFLTYPEDLLVKVS